MVEPAGTVKAGAGHLQILIYTDCIPAGQVISKDTHHLHYGQGQLEADLDFTPGSHTLWLPVSDGAHVGLTGEGMTQKLTITVKQTKNELTTCVVFGQMCFNLML